MPASLRAASRSSIARPITAKIAVAPPCMIAVPKPRTIHVPMPASGHLVQIVEVLDQRESGADGEAEDRRIDQEADAMRADQRDDDEALQQLLDDRRDVARVAGEIDAEQAEQRRRWRGSSTPATDAPHATMAMTARSFTSL